MVIFLDVDGVLNQLQGNYYLDDSCILNLGKLCTKLKAGVVLTSSWRLGYSNFGKCTPQIEELKKKFGRYNIRLLGRTRNLGNREREITRYVQDHAVSRYIILDDDISEFGGKHVENLYIINSKTGLTEDDVKMILK